MSVAIVASAETGMPREMPIPMPRSAHLGRMREIGVNLCGSLRWFEVVRLAALFPPAVECAGRISRRCDIIVDKRQGTS